MVRTHKSLIEQVMRRRQEGAITLFTAALILLLMTLMLFYATRTGIFEQRVSANDMNQKMAFHAAEAGVNHAIEYFFSNSALISSAAEDIYSDGTDGWMAAGGRWRKCSEYTGDFDGAGDELAHPCRGESQDCRRQGSNCTGDGATVDSPGSYFYYYDDPNITGDDPYAININTDRFLQSEQSVTVYALMCVLDVNWNDTTPVSGCTTAAGAEGPRIMVTFLARGQSDCQRDANGNVTECRGEALIVEPVSNFSALNGPPPSVPLTARSSMPDSGSSTILTHSNAGGVGVPISVWGAEVGRVCPGDQATPTDIITSGSFETCHAHEFYDSDIKPDNPLDAGANASCTEAPLSYPDPGCDDGQCVGYDVFLDVNFPCDLFQYYFGIPRSMYTLIKNSSIVIEPSGCADLTEDSSGLYWVVPENSGGGGTCSLAGSGCSWAGGGGTDRCIGSSENPVAIVSTAPTNMPGNARLSGVIFMSDAEDATPGDATEPDLTINAGAIIHGALVVDLPKVPDGSPSNFKFNGNFKLIYGGSEIVRAHDGGNLGSLMGGWTDFPKCWHAEGTGCP